MTIDDSGDCEDQALVRVANCTDWRCMTWQGETPVKPALVLEAGLWVCPTCRASYGRDGGPLSKKGVPARRQKTKFKPSLTRRRT